MKHDEAAKLPEMPPEQFARFKEQIEFKIEVDLYERVEIKPDGDIDYTPAESHESGFFWGNVFGNTFSTDMIDYIDLIYRAAELFIENQFDTQTTGQQIAHEFNGYA